MSKYILTEVCDFQGGSQPPKNEWKTTPEDGYIRMLQIRDFTQRKESFIEYVKLSNTTKTCNEDDILIGRYGASVGKILTGLSGAYNVAIMKTIPNTDILTKKFLFYYLLSEKFQNFVLNVGSRAAQAGFNKEDLSNIEIPLPPLETQKKIADELDKITGLIEKRKIQIEKLDLLTKAKFVEMFGDPVTNEMGWEKEKLEKHIALISGYPFDSSKYVDNGIKICGGLIIMPNKIIWKDCKYWNTTIGNEQYLLQPKDIVIALDRPWISEGFKIALVDGDNLPALLIQRTARIRAVSLNQLYLYHCFINGDFDRHCNVTGSLVPHISLKDIRRFQILIPPLSLQNQFAEYVEKVYNLRYNMEKGLERLEVLYKERMQEYFG